MDKLIIGLDEAGRGPLIGPLVIAGVAIRESKLSELEEFDIKDSKLISPKKRQNLFYTITNIAENFKIIITPAQEIDSRSTIGLNLNHLEALKCAQIIDEINPDIAYIDSPTSPRASTFSNYIRSNLRNKEVKLISKHKADAKYPIVGAASILAKVTRDQEIEKIKKIIGIDFGSGYTSDARTQEFIKKHYEDKFSEYVRKTWATFKKSQKQKAQAKLSEF
jgi:ribonuclease HII